LSKGSARTSVSSSAASWFEQAALDAIRQGGTLEDRFLEKAGADAHATSKLTWLEENAS